MEGTTLVAASELWRRWGPESVLHGPTFSISKLLTGRILDSSSTSDILYTDLCLQDLSGQFRQACADIRIAFSPDKTVILKTAEAAAFTAATLLLLERLTHPTPWKTISLAPLAALDHRLSRSGAYQALAPALRTLLRYRLPTFANLSRSAFLGYALAQAFSGNLNVLIDSVAAAVGGTPFHGIIASRNVFETLAFIVLPPFYVSDACLERQSTLKTVHTDQLGRPDAHLQTFEVRCNQATRKIYVHVLSLPHPEQCEIRYIQAAELTETRPRQCLSAHLDLFANTCQSNHPLVDVGHHFNPQVDWIDPTDRVSPADSLYSQFLDLGFHTAPDAIAVLNADQELLAITPFTWGGRAGINFGQKVFAHRQLAPSEYNAFCLKGALWAPALTQGLTDQALVRDIEDNLPLWKDLLSAPIVSEFVAGDPTTHRLLMVSPEGMDVITGEAGYERLHSLAQSQGLPELRQRLTLIRPGAIVRAGEVPQGRTDNDNLNGKSAINWLVLKDRKIQAFIIGTQTARFDYEQELKVVREVLQRASLEYDYLVDCDEHTAGKLRVPRGAFYRDATL
jgi:hypothetical protein